MLQTFGQPSKRHDMMPVGAALLRTASVGEALSVATENVATFRLEGSVRIIGLEPRFPITITLLIAMAVCLLGLFAPASAKRQGVLSSIPRNFSARPSHPKQEGRAQISRRAKRSAARA